MHKVCAALEIINWELHSDESSLHKLPKITLTPLYVSLSELTGLKFSYNIEEKQTNLQPCKKRE